MDTSNFAIETSAPGKLMLCGEWSILVPGNSCLVLAIDQRVHVKFRKTDHMRARFFLADSGLQAEVPIKQGTLQIESDLDRYVFLQSAVELCFRYFDKSFGFELLSSTDRLQTGSTSVSEKIGFGSSAAVTVATIGAFFAHEGLDIEDAVVRSRIFKLAALAHYHAQSELGSGFDIAASTFGGLLNYTSFDPGWVLSELGRSSLQNLIDCSWPGLDYCSLQLPEDFHLLVGWTGSSANTRDLLKEFNLWRQNFREIAGELLSDIQQQVLSARQALEGSDRQKFLASLNSNTALLSKLTIESGIKIETGVLAELGRIAREVGAAGKLSGAGGGDCGIAVCFDLQQRSEILSKWRSAGIQPLEVHISLEGLRKKI